MRLLQQKRPDRRGFSEDELSGTVLSKTEIKPKTNTLRVQQWWGRELVEGADRQMNQWDSWSEWNEVLVRNGKLRSLQRG